MAYDIIIKSGGVFDGESGAPVFADVGIKGDKIEGVGNFSRSKAGLIIDAYGKYVTPGFIDITNHSDTHLTVFRYPELESLIMQGVTTAIGGNCGASLAPLASGFAIDAVRKWADPAEINVNWNSFGDFLLELEKVRPAVNFGSAAGYGTLRRGVIGDEARPLSLEEKEKVKYLLREAIREGAFGLSLGLSYGHEKASATDEIIEIAGVMAETGGVIKIHLRSEGSELLAAVNEAVRIGRETGVSVEISHLKAVGKKAWPLLSKALELVSGARVNGVDINFDVSPYNTTGSPLYLLIPAWVRRGGFSDLFQRISVPEEKKKIIDALKTHTLHYDKILIMSAAVKNIVGLTVAEAAERAGLEHSEALLEIIRANEGRVSIVGRTLSLKNTKAQMADKNSFISSDGAGYNQEEEKRGNLVHPRSFGAFAHFWHRAVNDFKIVSPAEAVKKITSGPAGKIGLKKRGVVKKGNFADVLVFNPALMRDRSTYKNPFRYAAGIEWVIVNGKVAVERGKYLAARAGKILKFR